MEPEPLPTALQPENARAWEKEIMRETRIYPYPRLCAAHTTAMTRSRGPSMAPKSTVQSNQDQE
jgi:hypothetical protein